MTGGRGGEGACALGGTMQLGGIWREFGNSASGELAFAQQNGFGGFVSRLYRYIADR